MSSGAVLLHSGDQQKHWGVQYSFKKTEEEKKNEQLEKCSSVGGTEARIDPTKEKHDKGKKALRLVNMPSTKRKGGNERWKNMNSTGWN